MTACSAVSRPSFFSTATRSLIRSPNTRLPPHSVLRPSSLATVKFLCSPRQFIKPLSCSALCHANPTTSPASSIEPLEHESRRMIEKGSSMLEKGDIEGALKAYQQSISIRPSSTGYYNLGIALYQLKQLPEAIVAWEKSLTESPSADVHTNLASAYILSKPPEPFKALEHLKKAVELDPTDGEIRFNLGAVNEANDHLADALAEYNQARQLGVKRAEQNIRNVGAKLLRKKLLEQQAATKKDEDNEK